MKTPLKFTFNKIEDGYNNILNKTKSYYKEERDMRYLVEATSKYKKEDVSDTELLKEKQKQGLSISRYVPEEGEQFEVDAERKDLLVSKEFVKVIKEIKDVKEKVETATKEVKTEKAVKETTKKTTKKQ